MDVLLSFVGVHDPYARGLVGEQEQLGPILSLLQARRFDKVILFGTPRAWLALGSIMVERTAAAMADGLASMLRSASRIVFIDTHFRATRPGYQNTLRTFLGLGRTGTGMPQVAIELHAGHVARYAPPWDIFKQEWEQYLPELVPAGLTLIVRRWKNRAGGERLHNRYVLTDISGMQFGVGLDEGDPGTTDDVTRLDADAYRRRMEDYAGAAPAFDFEGEGPDPGEAQDVNRRLTQSRLEVAHMPSSVTPYP